MAPELLHPRTEPDDSQPTLDHLLAIEPPNKVMSIAFFNLNYSQIANRLSSSVLTLKGKKKF